MVKRICALKDKRQLFEFEACCYIGYFLNSILSSAFGVNKEIDFGYLSNRYMCSNGNFEGEVVLSKR